jgi:hypothetical protein
MGFSFLKKLFGGEVTEKISEDTPAEAKAPEIIEASAEENASETASAVAESPRGRRPRKRGKANGGASDSGASLEQLQDFVLYVASALVDYPDRLNLSVESTDRGPAITIRCEKSDIGKIVGKSGKTISAIRSLVSGLADKQNQRLSVEVLD